MIRRLKDIKTDASAVFEKDAIQLLMRIDATAITFVLAYKHNGEWNAMEEMGTDESAWQQEDFVQDLTQKSALASFEGLDTKVFFATPHAMPVPVKLVNEAEPFIKAQFGMKEATQIKTDNINEELAIAFAIPVLQTAIVTKMFPQAVFCSTLGLLVKQVLAVQHQKQTLLYLHLFGQQAEMALVQNGQLLLARSFVFATDEDLLYHLLNCCQQLHISPAVVLVKLQGQVEENATVFQLLQTYFSQVGFAETAVQKWHKAFRRMPAHYFTGLMEVL